MKLPNEMIAQLDGRMTFEEMTREEKTKEIKWCIERCEMNKYEYPEKSRYYSSQIRQLKLLLDRM